MIQDFTGGGADKLPDNIRTHLAMVKGIENLLQTTYPSLTKYYYLLEEESKKKQLLSGLRKRFKELEDESFEVDDGNKQDLPKEKKETLRANLKADKMRVFQLEKKIENELKLIRLDLDEMPKSIEEEFKRFEEERKKIEEKYKSDDNFGSN